MAFILVHGLGQDASSWDEIKAHLDMHVDTPDLFELLKGKRYRYQDLYNAFCEYLDHFDGPLSICGLSLGGILALDYAKHHPDRVRSLILIGTPHRIPRFLYAMQSIMFHLLPKDSFKDLGIAKSDFMSLTSSMKTLPILDDADKVKCKTLLICGSKDKANIKSLTFLHKAIKDSEVKIIDSAGHAVNEDKPLELADMISSFWKI